MSLYSEWNKLINNQTEATIHDFWKEYSETETRIYADILAHHTEKHEGVMKDLIAGYHANPVIFMGFLDGINSSLNTQLELEPLDEESFISLDIDYEKLLFNMYKADAKYLFGLEEWDNVLSPERREEIRREFKNSRTVHRAAPKVGRNDPCPCGSGKKYKNCCGKN